MNEQLQGKLVEILSGIQAATRAAGDFALEQLPDIAQQYVMFARVSSIVTLVLLVVAVLFFLWSIKRCWVWMKAEEAYELSPVLILPFGAAMFFAGVAYHKMIEVALVWFAPKVWLLKEIASLIK
jgi:hypothetical protein